MSLRSTAATQLVDDPLQQVDLLASRCNPSSASLHQQPEDHGKKPKAI
jgi:hypothetical protein